MKVIGLKDISVCYGKTEAVRGVSLGVGEGCIALIIGANGAGKSTIMRAISGLIPLTTGEIWFQNRRIDRASVHEIVKLGVVHIPEGRRLFPYMSVLANLRLGAYLRRDKAAVKTDLDRLYERFPMLGRRRKQLAGTLSGGEQQMLAIARGLMAKPKVILMDEPSLGLAPLMIEELAMGIKNIHKDGIPILLVEQNVGLAAKVGDFAYVLEVGEVVLEGKMAEIMTHEYVRKAFLGR
jgi:branched-chain amino acid transport system ATP-binding protein